MKILPWSLRLMEPRLKLRRRPSTWQLLRPCGEEEKADARRSMLLAEGLPAAPPALKVVFYLWNTHTRVNFDARRCHWLPRTARRFWVFPILLIIVISVFLDANGQAPRSFLNRFVNVTL